MTYRSFKRPGYERFFSFEYEPLSLEAVRPSVGRVRDTLEVLGRHLVRPLELSLKLGISDDEGDVTASRDPELREWILLANAPPSVRRTASDWPLSETVETITADIAESWMRRALAIPSPSGTTWWVRLDANESSVRVPAAHRASEVRFMGSELSVAVERNDEGRWVSGSPASVHGVPVTISFSLSTGLLTLSLGFLWSMWTEAGSSGCSLVEGTARALTELGWDDNGCSDEPDAMPGTTPRNLRLGREVRAGIGDAVHEGAVGEQRALVTLASGTIDSGFATRRALPFDGVAPILWLGSPAEVAPYSVGLAEALPEGQPASQLADRSLANTAALGAQVADVLALVHAAGDIVGGIRPELIYVADGRLAALVPRGPELIAAAMPRTSGMRSYAVPYLAPEALNGAPCPASDVFALCATLRFLACGAHPFGDDRDRAAMVARILTGAFEPWPDGGDLAAALEAGLAVDPAARPTAAALAQRLRALAAAAH